MNTNVQRLLTLITAKDATNYLCDLCALCGEINSAAHEVWYSGSGLKYDY